MRHQPVVDAEVPRDHLRSHNRIVRRRSAPPRTTNNLRKLHALYHHRASARGWFGQGLLARENRGIKFTSKHVRRHPARVPLDPLHTYMFSAISGAKGSTVSLRPSHPDLCAELKVWLSLSATPQEGPWHQARHYEVKLTTASSDASTIQYGGMVSLPNGPFSMGGSSRPTSYPGLYTVKTCSRY